MPNQQSQKIVAIIPARAGSKGVPDKNIKKLLGTPLVGYSIAAAKKIHIIGETFVSTDSSDYAAIVKTFGAKVPFLRPKELSADQSTDFDFIKHFLEWYKGEFSNTPKLLLHLRPTSPLRETNILTEAIQIALSNEDKITSLRSIHKMSESAYKCFKMSKAGFMKTLGNFNTDAANAARQIFPDTYQANGYIDILFPNYILKYNRLHGDKMFGFCTKWIPEIDTIEDFELTSYFCNKWNIKNRLFKE